VQAMRMEDQKAAYEQTQAAYEAYGKLTEEQQQELADPEEVFKPLFVYFNSLISADGELGSGTPDSVPPVLKELTISAATVTASGSIEVIGDASDDISGISSFSVWFESEELGETIYAFLSDTYYDETVHKEVSYPDGKYHGFLKADQYQETSVFILRSIDLHDVAGNNMYYLRNNYGSGANYAELPEALKSLQFTVYNSDADIITSVANSAFTETVKNAENDAYIVADYSGKATLRKIPLKPLPVPTKRWIWFLKALPGGLRAVISPIPQRILI